MNDSRKWIILGLFTATGLTFLIKLFMIQVLASDYKIKAASNAIKAIKIYPHRGLIYDRNGDLIASNIPVYDLMVDLKKAKIKDTVAFCNVLGITLAQFHKNMKRVKLQKGAKPKTFLKQISSRDFAKIQDKLIDYPGFKAESKFVRSYPHKSLANALGYIGEISKGRLKRDTTEYYQQGDYIGISGLEASYEQHLRGRRGVKMVYVDARGREKGRYKSGKYDTASVAGQDLISSIDLKLQQYGELLMRNKRGAIVAIEPNTGEILTMISAPSYDPNLLTGREFSKNYGPLAINKNKPLFNRAIRSKYPPGSTFKTVQALIGQQENVISAQTVFACNKSLVKCHWHPTADLQRSIQHSCNPYYFNVFRRIIYQNKLIINDSTTTLSKGSDGKIGFKKWRQHLLSFGLGAKIGVDLNNEKAGNVPSLSFYNKRFGEGKWKFSNIYSLSIGQGELGVTPLQIANYATVIANRGYYYTPHLIKGIGKNKEKLAKYKVKHQVTVDPKYFPLIIEGMQGAVLAGTVAPTAIMPGVEICGKTGTVQNPHGEDNSVFIAFAPKNNPKIAIAVYVENGGFGGVLAAPIATLMIARYLKGETVRPSTEKMVIDKSLIN
ncbi:penicillin-binding protein 2 [marine bacterium AO1-C]|nr:penicillin-binding protein 2 [marine bacterium AO1-C]